MVPAVFWVLGTAVCDHGADVGIRVAAELAAERTVRIPFKRLVVAPVRIVQAAVRHERLQRCVFLTAMDAEERAALVSLEKSMISFSGAARMVGARVREKAFCIRVFLSAVLAVFAHVIFLL